MAGDTWPLWLIFGLLLSAVEIFAAGFYLLFFGVAALLIAISELWFDHSLQAQLGMFAAFSLLSVLIGHRIYKTWAPRGKKKDTLNQDMESDLLGMTVRVVTPIRNGEGEVQLFDSKRVAYGPDAARGTLVRIHAVTGNRIMVELLASETASPGL